LILFCFYIKSILLLLHFYYVLNFFFNFTPLYYYFFPDLVLILGSMNSNCYLRTYIIIFKKIKTHIIIILSISRMDILRVVTTLPPWAPSNVRNKFEIKTQLKFIIYFLLQHITLTSCLSLHLRLLNIFLSCIVY
jgi:hypothetical protein